MEIKFESASMIGNLLTNLALGVPAENLYTLGYVVCLSTFHTPLKLQK